MRACTAYHVRTCRSLHVSFRLDVIKAFDSADRELLWEILRVFGVPEYLIKVCAALHRKFVLTIRREDVVDYIESTMGVRQGCNMAGTLFLFLMLAARPGRVR